MAVPALVRGLLFIPETMLKCTAFVGFWRKNARRNFKRKSQP